MRPVMTHIKGAMRKNWPPVEFIIQTNRGQYGSFG